MESLMNFRDCDIPCLQKIIANGNILLCRSPVVNVALGFGARGVIRREDGRSIFPLPVSDLGEQEFAMVEAYANSTE